MKIQGNLKICELFFASLISAGVVLVHIPSAQASVTDVSAEVNRTPSSKKAARYRMKRAIRPTWSKTSAAINQSNDSYLTSTNYVRNDRTLNDEIFGPDMDSRDIESSSQAYEISKVRGTENAQSEKGRFDRIRDYARRAMDKISRFHLKSQFQHAKKYAENMDGGAREPLAAAVIATSLYTGRTFNLRIADGVRLSSRTELKDKYASVGVQLPGSITSQVATERGSGVNASVSKQITDQISASVGTKDRGTAQVNYSVSF